MTTQTLYNGAVTIRRDGSHKYFVTDSERGLSDVWAPGVTGVSGKVNMDGKLEGLNKWAARVAVEKVEAEWDRLASLSPAQRKLALADAAKEHARKRDKAAETGTIIHSWVEEHIRALIHFGGEPEWPTDPQIVGGVERYLEWESQHHVGYLHTERYVYHRDDHFAGQADVVALVDGVLSLCDLKSSNYFSVDYVLQTAAYTEAYNMEFSGYPILKRIILMIDNKEGRLDVKDLGGPEEQARDYAAFRGCLAVRNWEAGLRERKEEWGVDRKARRGK